MGRELSASGRLSEAGLILSMRKGGGCEEWAERLRRILAREEDPGFELLTEIDSLLARPARQRVAPAVHADLFD